MVLRYRGQFCSLDRALRRERLRNRFGSSNTGLKPAEGVRLLELPDFPPVVVGASWSGKLSNISKQLLSELETEAQVQMRRMKSGGRG
jgi:hypothetical protein